VLELRGDLGGPGPLLLVRNPLLSTVSGVVHWGTRFRPPVYFVMKKGPDVEVP